MFIPGLAAERDAFYVAELCGGCLADEFFEDLDVDRADCTCECSIQIVLSIAAGPGLLWPSWHAGTLLH